MHQLINISQQSADPAAACLVLWVLQTQQNGCAKVWMEKGVADNVRTVVPSATKEASEEERAALKSKIAANPRVMFDIEGFWIARTPEALARLQDREAAFRNNLVKCDSRVPRNAMVVESLVVRK